MDEGSGNLEVSDERFVDDDLQTLCELGMLRPDISQGSRKFVITRQGAKVGG
jgi:hypothetical protein